MIRRLSLTFSACAALIAVPSIWAESFPPPNDTQPLSIPLLSPQEALSKMQLPPGFKATVFAAEPDLNNPIACCWDEKGRLWVAENYTYGDSTERYNYKLRDRILIFEDTDNDGKFDKRTVFSDQLQLLTSIERGLGGVWAVCPPNLLFIPDANNDDVPDGPPVVKLEGFSTQAASRHTFANGLKWGPDGWLYGRCGISSTSYVGTPKTPEKERKAIAGGLWRYHPTRDVYDIVCYGTTNPWGNDWDENGELFFINTVIGHLWHGIHGAHLKRMHGQDLNPRAYQLMDMIADHYHWDTGKSWTDSREGGSGADSMGGGHAHVGMTIYQGINWPKEYRGKVLTLNLGGRRVNVERLEKNGSTYIGKHEPDMLKTSDPWFRGTEITYGPDGGVYILDWSDIGECHENDGVHRNSGRIYKVTYGDAVKPKEADLTKLGWGQLISLAISSENQWLVQHARQELRERTFRDPSTTTDAKDILAVVAQGQPFRGKTWEVVNLPPALASTSIKAAAALKYINWSDEAVLLKVVQDKSPYVRQNALRLLLDHWMVQQPKVFYGLHQLTVSEENASMLNAIAKSDPASSVRLQLASLLQQLDPAQCSSLAAKLLTHAEDSNDPYLPLMYWYGIMDLPTGDLTKLFADCQIPLVRQFIVRRSIEDLETNPTYLNSILALNKHQSEVLAGMTEGLKGWAKAAKPASWDAFVAKLDNKTSDTEEQLRALNLLFGDGRALDDLKALALDEKAEFSARNNALKALITAKADGLKDICQKLLKTRGLNMTALQGLALFDDPAIGEQLAKSYRNFYPNEQPTLIDTLTSRKPFVRSLLRNLEPNGIKIPRNALTVINARQIRSFNDTELDKTLAEAWGEVRESSADKKQLIATLKAKLTPETLAKASASKGRVVFSQVCAACHKLYGEGNAIGPDLTGSGRKDVNYLIENIADPSALVAVDYRLTVVTMKDGRVLSGNIPAKTDKTLTVRMIGQEQTVERSEVASMQEMPISLMPEGLTMALNEEQLRDLIVYLMTDAQVPLP